MLSGGITNRNFLVTRPDLADRYVIRMGGTDTHLLGISREAEQAATAAAASVGVGPEVVAFIRPEGFLVTRFITGSPISPEQIRQPAMLSASPTACAASTAGRRFPASSCRCGSWRAIARWPPIVACRFRCL